MLCSITSVSYSDDPKTREQIYILPVCVASIRAVFVTLPFSDVLVGYLLLSITDSYSQISAVFTGLGAEVRVDDWGARRTISARVCRRIVINALQTLLGFVDFCSLPARVETAGQASVGVAKSQGFWCFLWIILLHEQPLWASCGLFYVIFLHQQPLTVTNHYEQLETIILTIPGRH